MAEEPEQVLPQDRVTAADGEELCPEVPANNNIRRALPSNGNAKRISPDCVRIVHEKMSRFAHVTFPSRSVTMVAMKLIAPIVADTPERWSPNNIRSTPTLAWVPAPAPDDNGVYIVQAVCDGTTLSIGKKPAQMRNAAGGNNQNAMAVIRGNAMSSAPIINGIR
mgnify:CR=1 FL=1